MERWMEKGGVEQGTEVIHPLYPVPVQKTPQVSLCRASPGDRSDYPPDPTLSGILDPNPSPHCGGIRHPICRDREISSVG